MQSQAMIRSHLTLLLFLSIGLFAHSQVQAQESIESSCAQLNQESELVEPATYRSAIFFDAYTPYTQLHKIRSTFRFQEEIVETT